MENQKTESNTHRETINTMNNKEEIIKNNTTTLRLRAGIVMFIKNGCFIFSLKRWRKDSWTLQCFSLLELR